MRHRSSFFRSATAGLALVACSLVSGCDESPTVDATGSPAVDAVETPAAEVIEIRAPRFDTGEMDEPSDPQSESVTVESQQVRVDLGRTSPSVGLTWQLEEGFDQAVMTVDGVERRSLNPDPHAVGGWFETSSTIVPVGPGTTEVVYSRWWRGKQMSTFTVIVTVR